MSNGPQRENRIGEERECRHGYSSWRECLFCVTMQERNDLRRERDAIREELDTHRCDLEAMHEDIRHITDLLSRTWAVLTGRPENSQETHPEDTVLIVARRIMQEVAALKLRLAAGSNLIAIMNGDGGHRQEEIGFEKAAKEAEMRFYRIVALADAGRDLAEAVRNYLISSNVHQNDCDYPISPCLCGITVLRGALSAYNCATEVEVER